MFDEFVYDRFADGTVVTRTAVLPPGTPPMGKVPEAACGRPLWFLLGGHNLPPTSDQVLSGHRQTGIQAQVS